MSTKLHFLACALILFSSKTFAFPVSTSYQAKPNGFTYILTSSSGVTADNVTQSFDKLGAEWLINVEITEDLTFDDELFTKVLIKHLGFGPEFNFNLNLDDDVSYSVGSHVLPFSAQEFHPTANHPKSYDEVTASLEYTVAPGTIFDNDFNFYRITLNGTHKDVPEPATLALFGLGLAGLALSKRSSRVRTTI